MAQYNKFLPFFLCVLLIIIALVFSWPLFKPGYFITDDGVWAVVRLAEMVRELKDLQFPPRWSDFLNHGYGYPLFSFVYPFPFYLAAVLKFIGFSYVGSIKILFILSGVLSALFMFLFINKLSGPVSAFIASVFYITAPYRLTDLYVRGSLGESLSFVLFPLIFYLTVIYNKTPLLIFSVLLSLSLAVLLLTHNVMALFFIPVWILFVTVLNKKHLVGFLRIFFLALSLSAYFIIPALFEKKYLFLSQVKLADPQNYMLTVNQLSGNFSRFQITALLLSLFNLRNRLYFFSLLMFSFFLFLTQKISLPLWFISPLNLIDFPSRAFAQVAFFAAILTSFLPQNKKTLYLGCILAIFVVLGNFLHIQPGNFFQKNDSFYFTNDATTTSMDELTPVWVKEKPKNRYTDKVEILKGNAQITDLNYNSKSINFKIMSQTSGKIQINTIYFPGWKLKINNNDLAIDYDNPGGLITFDIPPGEFEIQGKFKETPVRLAADYISLAAFVYLVFLIIKSKISYVPKI